RLEWRDIVAGTRQEHGMKVQPAGCLDKSSGGPGFFRRRRERMNHHIGRQVRSRPGKELRARNLRFRHAQPKDSRGEMFRRMDFSLDAENLLSPRNLLRIDKAIAMVSEPGPQPRS